MYDYMAKLIKVVDGDTIDCDIDLGFGVWMKNQRVRLYGINAPETRTKDLVEKEAGERAKLRLIAMMSDKFLLTSVKDKKGKFGRILGIINVPQTKILDKNGKKTKHIFVDVNKLLVKEGHAKEAKY
tara:strand:- start:125 stop:505 length:381 start_codon:yes stop_codon:yes gene_type:complete